MPRGKAPLVGVQPTWVHERTLPSAGGDPQFLVKWRSAKLPKPTSEEKAIWRLRTREACAKYFAFKRSNLVLTATEREHRIRKAKGNPTTQRNLDINSQVIADRRQRWPLEYGEKYENYEPPGGYWLDPLLVDKVCELAPVWEMATGRLPGTRDPESPGQFPFHEWITDLFESCSKKPPKPGSVRDILAARSKKSGP